MNNKRISGKKSFLLPWVLLLFFILPAAGIADTFDITDTKTIEYEPGCGHLRGFIYKPDGETPLFGAQVVLEDVENRQVFRSNVTDSTGDYELLNIPAGNYLVHILSRDKEYKVKTVDFLIKIRERKTTTISFSLKKAPGGFLFFLLEPCCDAAVIAGTALTIALIKKFTDLKEEEEQSPTQR
jgi:hypothetical protein